MSTTTPTRAKLYEDLCSIAAERDRYRQQVESTGQQAMRLSDALVDLLDSPGVKALAKGRNYELGPADPFTRRAIRKGWKAVKGES